MTRQIKRTSDRPGKNRAMTTKLQDCPSEPGCDLKDGIVRCTSEPNPARLFAGQTRDARRLA